MRAFHADPQVKETYLGRVRAHRAADEIVHGSYWQNGKGCAVGCTVHSSDHSSYEREMGIPRILARLEDGIFERMPNDISMTWPERFLEAIPIGADLALVGPQFLHWLLVDEKEGVIRFANNDRSKAAIARVGDLYARKIKGEEASVDDWWAARAEARDCWRSNWAAAADAADAAADAAAADADAAAAAADAAAAARFSGKWNATRLAMAVRQSEKLLELLAAAPVTTEAIAA